jgi:hypothetical protein
LIIKVQGECVSPTSIGPDAFSHFNGAVVVEISNGNLVALRSEKLTGL